MSMKTPNKRAVIGKPIVKIAILLSVIWKKPPLKSETELVTQAR